MVDACVGNLNEPHKTICPEQQSIQLTCRQNMSDRLRSANQHSFDRQFIPTVQNWRNWQRICDEQKRAACSMLLELGKRKSADHLTVCKRMVFWTLGCLQKNGAETEGQTQAHMGFSRGRRYHLQLKWTELTHLEPFYTQGAQLVEQLTGSLPTQVRFPGAARNFSPSLNFQCRLYNGVRTPPGEVACIYICAHVKEPVVHVRLSWIMETLKHPACTVGWVARLCRSLLSPGKATRISHRTNPTGTIQL